MTTYKQQITNLHGYLVAAGLTASKINQFSADGEPERSLHNGYHILNVELDLTNTQDQQGFTSAGDEIGIRITRYWGGEENASLTYTEAVQDMLSLHHDIESRTYGSGISCGRASIGNYQGRPEWLQLDMQFFINAFTTRA